MSVNDVRYDRIDSDKAKEDCDPGNENNSEDTSPSLCSPDGGGATMCMVVSRRILHVLILLEGKLLILFSGLCAVIVYSWVKVLSHLPVGQFSATLFFFSALFSLPLFFFQQKTIDFQGKFVYVLLRAGLGGLGGLLKLWAAREMEYGDSVAMGSLIPIFAAISSRILWKEKISVYTIGALVVGVVGVILIARPTFIFGNIEKNEKYSTFAFIIPLSASIIIGISYSFMRKIGTDVSPLLIGFSVSSCCSFTSILFIFILKDDAVIPECFIDRAILSGGALLIAVAVVAVNRGLALEKSGPGALIRNLDVVFAFIIQMLFFKSTPNVFSMLGAALIIGSAILVSANKLCCKNSQYEI